MSKRIRKMIAGMLVAGIGLGAAIKPRGMFTFTRMKSKMADVVDQDIAKLVAVSDKRDSKQRRRLEWGSWHDDCHDHHHHHAHHKDHAWWTYAQRGGPHADQANSASRTIGNVRYCRNIEGQVKSDSGGYSDPGTSGCDCSLSGVMGLMLRNEGTDPVNLHTIEVSLRDGGRQLDFDEEIGLDFKPGEELPVGVDREHWKWDSADTLIINGNYEDNGKNVSFHLEPIEICNADIKNKNPIGWEALSPVHVTYNKGIVSAHDGDNWGDKIRVAVVQLIRHNSNNEATDIACHDGWIQCDKMIKSDKDDQSDQHGSTGHWDYHDDSHYWHN